MPVYLLIGLCLIATVVRAREPSGELFAAIRRGDSAAVKLLLSEGADPNELGLDAKRPLAVAAASNFPEIAAALIAAGARVDATDLLGATALHDMVARGNVAMVELLLAHGADVGKRDGFGGTYLHVAAFMNQKVLVKLFLDRGIGPNVQDKERRTPVHEAASVDHDTETLELLLARGGDLHAISASGVTSLHEAAEAGSAKAVALLMAKGARINGKDKRGRTALHFAAFNGNVDVVRLLLAAGAEPKAVDAANHTPFEVAKIQKHDDAAKLLNPSP